MEFMGELLERVNSHFKLIFMVSWICKVMLFIKFGNFLAIMSLHVFFLPLCVLFFWNYIMHILIQFMMFHTPLKKSKAKEPIQDYAADNVRSRKLFQLLALSPINFLTKMKHIATQEMRSYTYLILQATLITSSAHFLSFFINLDKIFPMFKPLCHLTFIIFICGFIEQLRLYNCSEAIR